MVRPIHKINLLKRCYLDCNNPEKEKVVDNAIASINALPKLPEVQNE